MLRFKVVISFSKIILSLVKTKMKLNVYFLKFNKLITLIKSIMIKFSYGIFFLLIWIGMPSCKKEYKIATTQKGGTWYIIGEELSEHLIKDNISFQLYTDKINGSDASLKAIKDRSVDFGLLQNDTEVSDDVNVIIPLYAEVLQVTYNPNSYNETPLNPKDLLYGKNVCYGPKGSGTQIFVEKLLFDHLGLDIDSLTVIERDFSRNRINDTIDVSIHLSGLFNPQIKHNLDSMNAKFFKFKSEDISGFKDKHPRTNIIKIEKNAYSGKPKERIYTLSEDVILVCHKDTPEKDVSKIVKSLRNGFRSKKLPFVDIEKKIKKSLTTLKEGDTFSDFEVHSGVRRFIDPIEMKFNEIFSFTISILGFLLALIDFIDNRGSSFLSKGISSILKILKINKNKKIEDGSTKK